MNKTKTWVIIFGNLSEGFRIVGPFPSFDDAADYSTGVDHGGSGWVMEMETP